MPENLLNPPPPAERTIFALNEDWLKRQRDLLTQQAMRKYQAECQISNQTLARDVVIGTYGMGVEHGFNEAVKLLGAHGFLDPTQALSRM